MTNTNGRSVIVVPGTLTGSALEWSYAVVDVLIELDDSLFVQLRDDRGVLLVKVSLLPVECVRDLASMFTCSTGRPFPFCKVGL